MIGEGEDTMAYCSNCGNFIEDGSSFCSKCGAKVENSSNVATATIPNADNGSTGYSHGAADGYDAVTDIKENKVYAALAYLGILFFLPLVACPNSKFGRYHANQGLLLLIGSVLLNIVAWILRLIIGAIFRSPVRIYGFNTGVTSINGFGLVLSTLVTIAAVGVVIWFMVLGIINAANGKTRPLPIIGKIDLIK